jgi:hypothetical protein
VNRFLPSIAALLISCTFFGGAHAAPEKIVAQLEALPTPVLVNQFYESSLQVSNAEGIGVPGLRLEVRGRMPEHAHGLPSAPVVVEENGGHYRIKGLSFSMPGRWVIEILHEGRPLLRQEFTVRF